MSEFSRDTEYKVTADTGGTKGQKLARFDLLPVEALWHVAELYGEGAKKYEANNWMRGYDWSLSFAALQRHALQFWAGEDVDDESAKCHMAAVVFHSLALLQFWLDQETYGRFDDRPSYSTRENKEA